MQSINPSLRTDLSDDPGSVRIIIGSSLGPSSGFNIYIGSHGWVAHLSTEAPCPCGTSNNPFGASAAACFAVANVFRVFFEDQIEGGRCDRSIRLSLIDLDPTSGAPQNPTLQGADLGETHLVGVGAIGNGVAWTLSRIASLRGVLHLIDPEQVDIGNLQRYVLTTQADVGSSKVHLLSKGWSPEKREI